MKRLALIFSTFIFAFSTFATEKKFTQEEYISQWKAIAIEQMETYQIPASITLAQAILESGNGNSELAKNANNHFGIKCSDWKGDSYYKKSGENEACFRKYDHAKKSYLDHSLFLKNRSRYNFLFDFEINDYKSWAHGLKQAGYASNPKYPQLLIDLIERLNLNDLDNKSAKASVKSNIENPSLPKVNNDSNNPKKLEKSAHQVKTHSNEIKYIQAKKGDTFYRISKEFGVSLWQLYKYNEFGDKKDCLVEGDVVYLEPKKKKSKNKTTLTLKEETNLRTIAHVEGIKLKKLLKYNDLASADEVLAKGTKVVLK